LWQQASSGAWFASASYETLCVDIADPGVDTGPILVPYDTAALEFQEVPRFWWHCINGGAGSYGTDGYNRGATDFAQALVTAAQLKGWSVTETEITGPQAGTGENGVSFSNTVHVVTINAAAPTSTP
jgi:hypothetical protein